MANWQHLYFFDKEGDNYNMNYDSTTDMWTGDIFLPQVSIDLFEVGQLFILQKMIDSTNTSVPSNPTFKFGYPHNYIDGTTSGPGCGWEAEWKTATPKEIFLFQFDEDFIDGTQSALVQEPDGPPLVRIDTLEIPLNYSATQSINPEGYIVAKNADIKSIALQINIAFSSSDENTYKKTLQITDKCTNTIIAKFTVYAESIEEDERLRVMTQNMGYNVIAADSTIFRDTNLKEALPDFVEINLKRKEIMMEGSNIYPFIGSYKGLINAIKFFGYNNLKVKEFWKNVNANSTQFGKFIQSNAVDLFSPTVKFDDKSITLPNKNYRKTSMFSLIYRINKITPGKFSDEDLPLTEEVQDFTIEEVLIKLFGLKRKLEKEYLPLNAHIKDITAEADFFGLLEVTNTISRNEANTIRVGINTDFKVSPSTCTYLEDLRVFNEFCLKEAAYVGVTPAHSGAIINYCNAYIAPLTAGNAAVGANMIAGTTTPGQVLPPPPIGPDVNSVLGTLQSGSNVSIKSIAGVYAAYFARYAPNLNRTQANFVPGESSKSLPDQPGVKSGALITLTNDSFNNITWDTINSTWIDLNNANDFFTFDFNVQGANIGDIYKLIDPTTSAASTIPLSPGNGGSGYTNTIAATTTSSGNGNGLTVTINVAGGVIIGLTLVNGGYGYVAGEIITITGGGGLGGTFAISTVKPTGATHTVVAGDTIQTITDSLFTQITLLKTTQTDPWLWFDWSQVTNDIGPCIRSYGAGGNRFISSVILANPASGGAYTEIQLPGEILFTWDGIGSGNFTEIEWTIFKDASDVSPAYYFNIRGSIGKYGTFPITLPYIGDYTVEMKLFDLYNNISSSVKTDAICVDKKEVEYSGWYQGRELTYTWNGEGKYLWNDYGSLWDLPIEPAVTWDDETPSLYEALDRVNAILNTFGIGTNTDFQLANFQNDGKASFSGPYQWKNLNTKSSNWNNAYHLWWDMTATTGDSPAFFQFSEIKPNSYLKILDKKGNEGIEYFDFTVNTLSKAVNQLNVSTDPIINKYVYNLVMNAVSSEIFVQAVSRYYGEFGNFTSVDMVDVNGIRICVGGTGSTTLYAGGAIGTTTLYPPFTKALPINGMTLISLPALPNAIAVSDNFVETVARCVELILDPDATGIIYDKQATLLSGLATKKTIQRIGYVGMPQYNPSLETYLPGWDNTNDNNSAVDFVWQLGGGSTPADKITETLEHVLHTITTYGLPSAYPTIFNQSNSSGPVWLAMSEAINNNQFDTSAYTIQPGETVDDFNALLMREYLYLLIYAEWNFIATYVSGGSLAPEWVPVTSSDVATNNPLGHALYTNYISKVLAKPSTTILNSMFSIGGVSGYIPFESIPAGGDIDCLSRIYKSGQSISNNPTWNTAKFINDGKSLPPMTWAMFVYDKCRIVGKTEPRWTISNTTNSSVADIYFESKYLTYLFKDPGKYMITLELTDTNGNKYKKGRNILNIKQIN